MFRTMVFLVACIAATIAGWGLALIRFRPAYVRRPKSATRPAFAIGRYSISFERLFVYYTIIAGSLLLLQIVLLLGAGIGAASVVYDRAFAPFYRISFLMNSTGFLPIFALARRQSPRSTRILAVLFILLQLTLAAFATSKGTLITLVAYSIVCWYFAGRAIPRRMVWIGVLAIVVTAFVFYPAMALARQVVRIVVTDPKGWRSLFATIAWTRDVAVTPPISSLSSRLGGFDWLLGLVTFGREQFPHWVSTSGDFIHVLNDLVPGDIIDVPGYVPVEQLIPMYLRSIPTVEALSGHAEAMGIAGMAYLYYGFTLGPLFFLAWSFVTTKIMRSEINTLIKILYFSCFVVVMVISGGFIAPVERFYEGLLTFVLLILIDVFIRIFMSAAPGERARRHSLEPDAMGASQ